MKELHRRRRLEIVHRCRVVVTVNILSLRVVMSIR